MKKLPPPQDPNKIEEQQKQAEAALKKVIEQLKTVTKQAGAEWFPSTPDQKPRDIALADLAGARIHIRQVTTAAAIDLVRQVATLARQVTMPKPDDTLVALAAASAGR